MQASEPIESSLMSVLSSSFPHIDDCCSLTAIEVFPSRGHALSLSLSRTHTQRVKVVPNDRMSCIDKIATREDMHPIGVHFRKVGRHLALGPPRVGRAPKAGQPPISETDN